LNNFDETSLIFYPKTFSNLINNLNEDKTIDHIKSTKYLISIYNDICLSNIKILNINSSLYTDKMKKINLKLLLSILKGKNILTREEKICSHGSIKYGNLENKGIIVLNPIYETNSTVVKGFTVLSPFINLLQFSKTLDVIYKEPVLNLTESFTPDKNEIQDILTLINNFFLFENIKRKVDLHVIF
jgi:hypothetical protein